MYRMHACQEQTPLTEDEHRDHRANEGCWNLDVLKQDISFRDVLKQDRGCIEAGHLIPGSDGRI